MSIKSKTIKGFFWSAFERFSVQGLQFVLMLIMARLLSPEDYGLIGMLAIFIAISQSLIDSGFSQALIRKNNCSDIDYSTVFYFNIIISIVLYLILYLIAPYIAIFYNTPELCIIMRVISFGIFFNSFAVVQRAIFTKHLNFKIQAEISFFSAFFSGIIGILLAYKGYKVWALVYQQLINLFLNTYFLWTKSKWRPIKIYSWQSFNELFSFGSKLLISGLLDTIYRNIYPIIIGKFFSPRDLGYYTRADHFAQFPSSNITGVIQRVTYPTLCIMQDNEKLKNAYRRILRLSAYIIFPLMIGLSAVSKPLLNIIIGPQWDECAKLLRIICFSMMFYPIHAVNLNLLQVKGRSDLFLRLEIIKKFVGCIILFLTLPFGLIPMCYGQILISILALIINTYYTSKLFKIGFLTQMYDILPTIVLCALMFILVQWVLTYINDMLCQLLVGILVGFIFYILCSYIFRFKEIGELLSIMKIN